MIRRPINQPQRLPQSPRAPHPSWRAGERMGTEVARRPISPAEFWALLDS